MGHKNKRQKLLALNAAQARAALNAAQARAAKAGSIKVYIKILILFDRHLFLLIIHFFRIYPLPPTRPPTRQVKQTTIHLPLQVNLMTMIILLQW